MAVRGGVAHRSAAGVTRDPADPKGLIADAFAMDGLGAAECRSIFLDWALSLPGGADYGAAVRTLIARHAAAPDDHPMQAVLRAALDRPPGARRRGGWQSRRN